MKCYILLALFVGLAVGQNDYNFDLFREQIEIKCLNRLWSNQNGQRDVRPFGQTLESFISMVELVEGNHTDWSIYEVSKALLKRFAFEGIEFKDNPDRTAVQSDDAKARWKVTRELVGQDNSGIEFDENNLSDDEKCTLFFVMGHLVNETFRDGVDDVSDLNEAPAEAPQAGGILRAPSTRRRVKQPREQGVVNVHGSKEQAIAMAMVLNAILASSQAEEIDVKQVYNYPNPMKMRPLVAVTLGEVLTRAALRPNNNNQGDKFFGPGGDWNSTICPTEFKLRTDVTGVTTALLRGAIDGLLIGKALKEGLSDVKGARLSRVLRMYYSNKGLPKSNGQQEGYSYCRREDANTVLGELGGQESIISYYHVYWHKREDRVPNPGTEELVSRAISNMNSAIQSLQSDTATEECKFRSSSLADQPTCETPSHLFVILDGSERSSNGFTEQEDIVGMLASRLDFGRGAGKLSIFQSSVSGKQLNAISYNATNPTCATCKTVWLDSKHASKPDGEFQLMEALNETLKEFERKTDLEPGVPSKVVVLFHFDQIKENKNRLKQAGNMLRDGHRDTRIFAVGENKDGLSPLVSGDANVITEITYPEVVAKDLESRICKVPAIFQFNNCFDHKSTRNEAKNVYTGYVTENHVQFWAFYPEYFLKSLDIKIKFRAQDGDITVCEQRGVDNPGYNNGVLNKQRCKKTEANNRELTFTFKNPCEGYQVHNCPAINFAVIGEASTLGAKGCPGEDMKCRRVDQIGFQMSHDGISCSGCEFLKASPVILAIIFVFSLIKLRQ